MAVMPHNIQIELVEGCNRMCPFCGIYSIWKNKEDRKIKYMDTDLSFKVADSLYDWGFHKKRIEFAMHGEPTLHPCLLSIIQYYRSKLPKAQLQLTTNGILLLSGKITIESLFDSGLNILIVDLYKENKMKLLSMINKMKRNDISISDYYNNGINPYHYNGNKIKTICLMDDIGSLSGKRAARTIINHAGNSNQKYLNTIGIKPIISPLNKKCSRPFREVSIHWDGTMPICCLDWRHEHIVGKFPEDGSIDSIWNSDYFQSLRYQLFNKNRTFLPCYRCNYNGGFRLGFLHLDEDYKYNSDPKIVYNHIEDNKKFRHKNSNHPAMFSKTYVGILNWAENKGE